MLGELGLKAKLTARLTCKLQTVMDTSWHECLEWASWLAPDVVHIHVVAVSPILAFNVYMIFTARSLAERGIVKASCLSVCLYVSK